MLTVCVFANKAFLATTQYEKKKATAKKRNKNNRSDDKAYTNDQIDKLKFTAVVHIR